MKPPAPADLKADLEALVLARSGLGLAIRVASGVTRKEVAFRSGVTSAAVGTWERKVRVPGAAALAYGRVLVQLVKLAADAARKTPALLTNHFRTVTACR